jgi:ribokinase
VSADRDGVVSIGSAHVDLIATADHIPEPGESVGGDQFRMAPGGKAGNQAAQCALLGISSSLIARLGNDPFGDYLVEALGSRGVDMSWCPRDSDAPTGASPIHVDATGEYASIIVPGAAAGLSANDLDRCRPLLGRSRYALLQLELPEQIVELAANVAKQEGCTVILNASPVHVRASDLVPGLLDAADMVIVNRRELLTLTAEEPSSEISVLDAAAGILVAFGFETVVVTLGSSGALAVTREGAVQVSAPHVRAVDTIGAGDALLGTFVTNLLQGSDTESALRSAVAAGALTVTRQGAFDALPDAEGLSSFLAGQSEVGAEPLPDGGD